VEENPLAYNMRTQLAFSHLKIKKWVFDGPIGIVEENPISGMQEMHIIDKLCYLGSVMYKEDTDINAITHEYSFDVDTYKILERHLRSAKKVKIQKLTKKLYPPSYNLRSLHRN